MFRLYLIYNLYSRNINLNFSTPTPYHKPELVAFLNQVLFTFLHNWTFFPGSGETWVTRKYSISIYYLPADASENLEYLICVGIVRRVGSELDWFWIFK